MLGYNDLPIDLLVTRYAPGRPARVLLWGHGWEVGRIHNSFIGLDGTRGVRVHVTSYGKETVDCMWSGPAGCVHLGEDAAPLRMAIGAES